MAEPEGRPLIDILGEMDEGVSLITLMMMKEAQASINLDGNTQSIEAEPMKDLVGVAEYGKPPSETILNTVGHQAFYLVESLDEVMERANEMDDNTFAMIFDIAPQGGMGQARRVLIPWQAVDSIIDLSPEPVDG